MRIERKTVMIPYDFRLGDVLLVELTTGEKIRAKAVKDTLDGMLFIAVDCLKKRIPHV